MSRKLPLTRNARGDSPWRYVFIRTGARYGAVNTLDDWGQPRDFVTSGLTDEEQRRVALSGRALKLTSTEYELLRVLSLNAGRVSTYATLQRRVWGRHHHGASKLVRA